MAEESTGVGFEAEAEIEQRLRSTSEEEELHSGKAAVLASQGGIEDPDEHTPLLAREGPQARSYSNDSQSSENAPQWDGQVDFEGLPWWMKPSMYWMLAPFALYALAFGSIIVPKTNLIKQLVCRDYYTEQALFDPSLALAPIQLGRMSEECEISEVNSKTSLFLLGTTLVSALLAAITSPKIGALSDRYGRIIVISITACSTLLGEIFTIVAATYPDTFNVHWFYLGFIMEGLGGSFIAGMALAHAYAVDCTPPSRRNVAFGYFHGALFIGIALGPSIGGLMIKATGDRRAVFFLALASHIFFITFVAFVVPESLSKRRQIAAREKHAILRAKRDASISSWASKLHRINILEPLKILYPTGPGTSAPLRRNLIILAAIDTTTFGVAMGSMSVMLLYMGYQFHWGDVEQAIVLSITNVCRAFALFVILPIVSRVVRGPSAPSTQRQKQTGCDRLDLVIIRIATLLDTIGFLGFTLARTGPLYVLSGCITAFGGIGSPTLQSALTKHVPADRVGALLGATGLLHALARVVAPIVCNAIFSKTVGKFTQAVFATLCGAFGIAALMTWLVRSRIYLDEAEERRVLKNDSLAVDPIVAVET